MARALTNSRGEYALRLAEGGYDLKARQQSFQDDNNRVSVRAGGATRADFELRQTRTSTTGTAVGTTTLPPPVRLKGQLAGRVTDGNGKPIAGAIIGLQSQRRTSTDQEGNYTVAELTPDSYQITVIKAGFTREDKTINVRGGISTRQDFVLKTAGGAIRDVGNLPKAGIVLARTGQITGRVIDGKTGAPLASVTVSIGGQRTVTTGANGSYSFTNVAPGTYHVTARKSGFTEGQKSVTIRGADTVPANFALTSASAPTSSHFPEAISRGVDGNCLPTVSAPTVCGRVITLQEENMMRRTIPNILIVTAIGLMPLMHARSQKQVDSRTAARSATIKRVQVNAQTITALPRGKKYVVDLTQRGVTYEFDAKTNLSRVMVRTAQGAVAIGPWVEKTFLKGKLAGLKWTSQSFFIRTRPAGPLTPPSGTPPSNDPSKLITCDPQICSCIGEDSCDDMLDIIPLCGDIFFCKIDPISRQEVCSCAIRIATVQRRHCGRDSERKGDLPEKNTECQATHLFSDWN